MRLPLQSAPTGSVTPWVAEGVHRRILRAASVVTAATIVVKAAGVFKDVTVADLFGCSDAMDAYLAAALLPALLVNLISESMNQALVPTLIRVREQEGQAAAQRLFSSSMLSACLMLTTVSAALALGARAILPLIASHYFQDKLALAIRITYALLPTVLVTGIASNCAAVLNSFDRFAWPALAPAAIPLATIATALCLGRRWGIWAVVLGNVAGALAHAVALAWMTHLRGYRLRLWWYGQSQEAREVAGQYGPVFLSSIVASGGLLVDQSMAAMLPPGSVSRLAYANRFVSVALAVLGGGISTAITPHISRLIAYRDWEGCREALRTWLRLSALISIPLATAMIAGSHWLIRTTLEHGVFQREQTAAVTPVLGLCAIQIPFFVCSRVFYRFLVAMRRTDLVLLCGALNLALDILFNIVLMRWFGLAGIALSTSLWTVSTFFFLWYWARRLLSETPDGTRTGEFSRANYMQITGRIPTPAQYLLRFDDLCPTMDPARWQRFVPLIEQYGLRPILAVVPDNQDPALRVAAPHPAFWAHLRALEAAGATLALHGYRHLCKSNGRSLVRLHRLSEFAGVDGLIQRQWIHAGIGLLLREGLDPKVWVAPRHGFDHNTLRALRKEGIQILSDGFARIPYTRAGMTWLPQQIWSGVEKQEGLWCICIHSNTATDAEAEDLCAFVGKHADQFTSVERVLSELEPRALPVAEAMYAWKAFWRFRIGRVRASIARRWSGLLQGREEAAIPVRAER